MLTLAGCHQPEAAAPAGNAVSEYTAILIHLDAARDDIRALRDEVAALQRKLGEPVPAASPSPAPAPPPAPEPAAHTDADTALAALLDGDDPEIGDRDAALVLLEFSDYECPYCVRFNRQTLPALKANYIDTGKLKLVTRDLPLTFHERAIEAALAANCAAEQGRYEAMREALYDPRNALSPALYRGLAARLGLDTARFEACLLDPRGLDEIERDAALAARLGVDGTPSFFIGRVENGRLAHVTRLAGAQPYPSFARAIDRLLEMR